MRGVMLGKVQSTEQMTAFFCERLLSDLFQINSAVLGMDLSQVSKHEFWEFFFIET